MKKLAFIYNPKAGKSNLELHLSDIINVFSEADFETTMIPTKRKNYCRDYIAEEGSRFDMIVVSGGDGTINEAFNALMQFSKDNRPVLGYIPRGTTNDFAASCMIPTDPFYAAKVAVEGIATNIDAGKFNENYFAYIAAFGVFTDVAYDTPQQIKNIFGYAAYIMEGVKRLNNVKSYPAKVTINGTTIEDEFIFGMVANSRSVGGMKIKSLNVDLCDGLFEVILLKKISKATDINQILIDLKNRNLESNYYYVFQTDKLQLKSHDNIAWTIDGEFGGEHTYVEIENIPEAIKIKVNE